MANKHIRRCSTSSVIREMQIKTTMRYHYTPIGLAKINQPKPHQVWADMEELKLLCTADWNVKYSFLKS